MSTLINASQIRPGMTIQRDGGPIVKAMHVADDGAYVTNSKVYVTDARGQRYGYPRYDTVRRLSAADVRAAAVES